jgi:hypothetical protein
VQRSSIATGSGVSAEMPPKTNGSVAPSISGIATCIPACTGLSPVRESCHASTVCTSRLTAERNGTSSFRKNSTAASLSFIAGPPTKLKPVSDTIWPTSDWPSSLIKNFSHASRLSMKVEMAGSTAKPSRSTARMSAS